MFPLGEKRENTRKKGPRKHLMPSGPLFFVPDIWWLEKIYFLFIHRMKVQGGPPLSKKKTHQLLLLFCVNAKNEK